MGLVILAFLAVFLLFGSAGVLLFYREQMVQRLSAVISPEKKQKNLMETIQESGFSLSGVVEHLEKVIPKSQAEVGVTQQRLIRAGYRNESSINVFYGAKALVPLMFAILVFTTG